jgi:hypothetical protein
LSRDEDITELSEAARRAGYIVTEHIDSIVERAQQQAEAILRQAERDAEDTRREAVAAGKRLLDRIHALEFPLGELVLDLRDEMDRVSKQLEAGDHVDSDATALPAGPARAPNRPAPYEVTSADTEERDVVREAAGPEPDEDVPEPHTEEPETEAEEVSEPDADVSASEEEMRIARWMMPEDGPEARRPRATAPQASEGTEEEGGKGTLTGRRAKPKTKGAFIAVEGHCAVCHRSFKAGSAAALNQSGWSVNGDVGLCPDCQADRWELPEGARLPVRPGGA